MEPELGCDVSGPQLAPPLLLIEPARLRLHERGERAARAVHECTHRQAVDAVRRIELERGAAKCDSAIAHSVHIPAQRMLRRHVVEPCAVLSGNRYGHLLQRCRRSRVHRVAVVGRNQRVRSGRAPASMFVTEVSGRNSPCAGVDTRMQPAERAAHLSNCHGSPLATPPGPSAQAVYARLGSS
jgi:hypothetical protein